MKTICLRNGAKLPALSFGCAFGDWTSGVGYQGFLPEQAHRSVTLAFGAGHRSFDGAHAYSTERAMGQCFGRFLAEGKIVRDDLFITSKFAQPNAPGHIAISPLKTFNPHEVENPGQRVKDDVLKSLDDLGFGYLDLALIHWPSAFVDKGSLSDEEVAQLRARVRAARAEVWLSLLACQKTGFIRNLGVSNFTENHLWELLCDVKDHQYDKPATRERALQIAAEDPTLVPVVNQIELSPVCFVAQAKIRDACAELQILIQAYAPFASGAFGLLKNEKIGTIGQKYGATTGEVIIKWLVQHGFAVAGKATSESNMTSLLKAVSLPDLSTEDMEEMDNISATGTQRSCPDPYNLI